MNKKQTKQVQGVIDAMETLINGKELLEELRYSFDADDDTNTDTIDKLNTAVNAFDNVDLDDLQTSLNAILD